MSGMHESRTALLSSNAVEARAVHYLQRRQFWNWTREEQAELDKWLAESSVHLVTYLRLEAAWKRTERLVALQAPERRAAETPPRRRFWSSFANVAAIMGIVTGLSAAGWRYFESPQDIVYTTAVGAHRIVALGDHSAVELNTDTILRLHGRTAKLEKGEAYFQIRHDGAHPFVVWAAGHRITDLGTKFVVRNEGSRLEVTLVEGRARVESAGFGKPARSANLEPGDIAIVTADAINVAKKPMQDVSDRLGWRRGLLTFRHAALADAAAEFNRYNAAKLIIADAQVGRKKIVGTFQARNVDLFAQVIRELLGLRVSKTGGDIVISR
jgi:transmembrane sensor